MISYENIYGVTLLRYPQPKSSSQVFAPLPALSSELRAAKGHDAGAEERQCVGRAEEVLRDGAER